MSKRDGYTHTLSMLRRRVEQILPGTLHRWCKFRTFIEFLLWCMDDVECRGQLMELYVKFQDRFILSRLQTRNK